jgi:FkbM family methyltransferase
MKRWLGQLSPEPETCSWIDSLPRGEVFFDIGANVGTFSVRASIHGMQVVAFEPCLEHYVELCGIIERNQLPILAFNLALSDQCRVGSLGRGRSTHTLLEHQLGKPGVFATTVDDMVEILGVCPQHVKIDVDGDEPLILTGMADTLPHVKSLLVEVDPGLPGHPEIPGRMGLYGFTSDSSQVAACRVQSGKYIGMANYVFRRK